MKRKVPVFRELHAEVDLTEHILRLLDERPASAGRFVDAIEGAFQRLSETPEVGARRAFKNPRLRDMRMWPVVCDTQLTVKTRRWIPSVARQRNVTNALRCR